MVGPLQLKLDHVVPRETSKDLRQLRERFRATRIAFGRRDRCGEEPSLKRFYAQPQNVIAHLHLMRLHAIKEAIKRIGEPTLLMKRPRVAGSAEPLTLLWAAPKRESDSLAANRMPSSGSTP
jgi:hypothetical protein